MEKINNSKEISMQEFEELCNSKEMSREELENVAGGCGSTNETITVYCKKCKWETKWSGKHFIGDAFIGPCPVCGMDKIYRKY